MTGIIKKYISNAELIKQLKIEIDTMKKNSLIREKMIEFMIYFFNKNKIHYDESGKETVMINPNDFNLEKLQYELILLENYIFLERSESNEKKKLPKYLVFSFLEILPKSKENPYLKKY